MSKKLNTILRTILSKKVNEDSKVMPNFYQADPDIRFTATLGDQEAKEPQDKVLIAIEHHFINGDFDKASELLNSFRNAKGGTFFTYYHMSQLMDWVKNIYKYTNMKEFSRNYYDHAIAKDMKIQGVDDLTKVRVRDEVVEKFVQDTKKILTKKLKMR